MILLALSLLGLTLAATNMISTDWSPSAIVNNRVTTRLPEVAGGGNIEFDPVDVEIGVRWLLVVSAVILLFSAFRFWRTSIVGLLVLGIIAINYFYVFPGFEEIQLPQGDGSAETTAGAVYEFEDPDNLPADAPALEVPDRFGTIVSILLGLLVGGFLLAFVARLTSKNPNLLPETDLAEQLAVDAQTAIEEIETGFDLRGAILKAYAQMSHTVRTRSGLVRRKTETAREFEADLIKIGLPSRPVERLTRLFEQVRYSPEEPGVREQREAVSCLAEIIEAVEKSTLEHRLEGVSADEITPHA